MESATESENRRPALRREALDILSRLSPSQREALLIKCWMSHDARWYMAVAREFGIEVADRLNRRASHDVGLAEAKRLISALQLPPVKTLDDYLLMQEVAVAFFGPDLVEYDIVKVSDRAFEMRVRRCFAYENIVKAGVAANYGCGILSRTTGWPEALGLKFEVSPPLTTCLKTKGQECVHAITFESF